MESLKALNEHSLARLARSARLRRGASLICVQQQIPWLLWVFLVSITQHWCVLMRNCIIYSACISKMTNPGICTKEKPRFFHPGRLAGHWLHVQSVNVHLGWSETFSNGSKCLTSLHKRPTDERQHGAAGASRMHEEPSLHGRHPARSSGSSEASQPSSWTPTRGKKNHLRAAAAAGNRSSRKQPAADWKLRLLWSIRSGKSTEEELLLISFTKTCGDLKKKKKSFHSVTVNLTGKLTQPKVSSMLTGANPS